jgi:hypothetical protein
MSEKPILFSCAMVRAILAGRKTQTRRVILPQIDWKPLEEHIYQRRKSGTIDEFEFLEFVQRCPYGQLGDRLWVRETWATHPFFNKTKPSKLVANFTKIFYRADEFLNDSHYSWRPSIHMPRSACRLTLEIVDVWVERVREISEADAQAEGVIASIVGQDLESVKYRAGFQTLWDEINAKRGFGWEVNPWVWVIEFKVDAVQRSSRLEIRHG